MKLKNLTEIEKNKLVAQYEPLINKLVNQYVSKGIMTWDAIKSMAYEGFALAINKYDEERSTMTFTQYAAFSIRNHILSSIDQELRVVSLSNYAQKKAVESGQALFNSISIDRPSKDEDDHRHINNYKMNAYTPAKFADGDVFDHMKVRLEETFNERDCKMFYMSFGLNGYDETKGKDIAREMNCSEGLVSQKIKKMTTWIRKDDSICESLQTLLQ